MAVQVSYPGVYIEEFAPGAPIEGVGTSTAAFIGIATKGVADVPTKLTSFDQFRDQFADQPVPGHFLWYAVRGFFENGGQVCYVVRASNGTRGETSLDNRAGHPLATARTREPSSTGATVTVTGVNRMTGAAVFAPTGTYGTGKVSPRSIALDAGEALKFRPADVITVASGGEAVRIQSIVGDTVNLADALVGTYAGAGSITLVNPPAGARTLRIQPAGPVPGDLLVPGAVLTILDGGAVIDSLVVDSVQFEATTPGDPTYRVTFRQGLRAQLDLAAGLTVRSEEFTLASTQAGSTSTHLNLSVDPTHPRYWVDAVNRATGPVVIELVEPPPADALPDSLPDDATAGPFTGTDESLATLDHTHFLAALDSLRVVDDVNLVSVPDCVRLTDATTVQMAVITHCEQLGDRFGVIDALPGLPLFGTGSVEEQRAALDSTRGYAALYYPWLRVSPAGPGLSVLVPPSGHVCGIMARSDNTRGVHKAPANEIVAGALGVERTMTDTDQGQLNFNRNVNVIRVFQTGGRPVLNGARTTATDRNWQYVNIRRLFLFLEESIQEGIRWAVFEPNNLGLWAKLKRAITDFLTRAWRDGALFGATAKDAFYVRIDETLNPDSERALGRLTIEIGVRPSYPAEFIVVRIGIWQGGSTVSES
jgi:phage tail sheath protein FI